MAIKDAKRRELIAGKLRGNRAEAHLSQVQVGEAVKVDKSSIGKYENGVTVPDVETAWDMANLYGVSLDELIGRKFERDGEVA